MCKELEDIKSEEGEVDGEEDEVDEVDQEDPLDLSVPIPNPSVSFKRVSANFFQNNKIL